MFKFAKYYFLLNIFQRTKRNLIIIVIASLLFVLCTYMFSDLIAMADNKLGLLTGKWMVLLFLLMVIIVNMVKIFKMIQIPFQKEECNLIPDPQKEKLMAKEELMSRSDLILGKYRKTQ